MIIVAEQVVGSVLALPVAKVAVHGTGDIVVAVCGFAILANPLQASAVTATW